MNSPELKHATLNWNENGTPVSREFDDVYFSNENGLEETRYVFLAGNQLPERFTDCTEQRFIVAETGFGTGLNFLTLWQAFRQYRQQNPTAHLTTLRFISFEKFPLQQQDLIQAHQHWPELAELSAQLDHAWSQQQHSGCQTFEFDEGQVELELWFGDVHHSLPQLKTRYQNKIDCWFLDGFAPSKNPDMWQDSLFEQMFDLTKPSGTFATFTAAGFVRRGLQSAGFQVTKRKGFGHKRDMLVGEK